MQHISSTRSITLGRTEWGRWYSGNRGRNWNLTIRTNSICTTPNPSGIMRHTNSLDFGRQLDHLIWAWQPHLVIVKIYFCTVNNTININKKPVRSQLETIQTTVLRSAGILRVLDTWGELLSLNPKTKTISNFSKSPQSPSLFSLFWLILIIR